MPTTQKIIMADISSDQALNGLKIKSDTLPGDWMVTLVNPKNGEPAEQMTIARFTELFTLKQPEVTESSKGLMSSQSLRSNPGHMFVNRIIFDTDDLKSKNSYRIKINKDYANFNIKILGGWNYGLAHGVLEKVISLANGSISGTKVYKCSGPLSNWCYISDPYLKDNCTYVDIINKASGPNRFAVILESYAMFTAYEFMNNQTPRSEDLTKNNRDETEFAFITSVNTLAASPNVLTDTISTSPVLESRQVRSTCLQNHLYQILLPTCQDRMDRMVQHQLEVNYPNNMSGQSTRSAALSWNYRKKIENLNKSSISLTIARYNKCNLPRAGPPRLIN